MNSRSTPGAAAVAPATSTSVSGSPLSSTRRRLVSTGLHVGQDLGHRAPDVLGGRQAVDLRHAVVDAHVAELGVVDREPHRRALEDRVEQAVGLVQLALGGLRLGHQPGVVERGGAAVGELLGERAVLGAEAAQRAVDAELQRAQADVAGHERQHELAARDLRRGAPRDARRAPARPPAAACPGPPRRAPGRRRAGSGRSCSGPRRRGSRPRPRSGAWRPGPAPSRAPRRPGRAPRRGRPTPRAGSGPLRRRRRARPSPRR